MAALRDLVAQLNGLQAQMNDVQMGVQHLVEQQSAGLPAEPEDPAADTPLTDMRKLLSGIVLLFALQLTGNSLADEYKDERKLFIEAEAALKAGDDATFRDLKRRLVNYPLYSYLEYEALRRREA